MNPEKILSTMKTVFANHTEVIGTRVPGGLEAFTSAKEAHTASMIKLNDINTSIRLCEQERQTALREDAQAEQNWRDRFRSLCGNITPEMKAEHSQRVASRELAEEFTGLIAELEDDKTRAMLAACRSGDAYVAAHASAFTAYADSEWKKALITIDPLLIRALLLRIQSLEISGETSAWSTALGEMKTSLHMQSAMYVFDMENEPVLSVTGMRRPALTGVDMKLYRSPAKRIQLAKELSNERTPQAEG